MALVRWQDWDPFSDMRGIRERINRLFDERFAGFPAPTEQTFSREWAPPVDIHEDKDSIVVKAELPGMKKEDVSIELKTTSSPSRASGNTKRRPRKRTITAWSGPTERSVVPFRSRPV